MRLGVTPTTVRRWLTDGLLAGVRVGGRYRVDPVAVEQFVEPAACESTTKTGRDPRWSH